MIEYVVGWDATHNNQSMHYISIIWALMLSTCPQKSVIWSWHALSFDLYRIEKSGDNMQIEDSLQHDALLCNRRAMDWDWVFDDKPKMCLPFSFSFLGGV